MIPTVPPEVVGGVAAGLAVLLVLTVIYRYLLRICRPNEILIFSGRKHKTTDGRSVGYRVVFGGRGVAAGGAAHQQRGGGGVRGQVVGAHRESTVW